MLGVDTAKTISELIANIFLKLLNEFIGTLFAESFLKHFLHKITVSNTRLTSILVKIIKTGISFLSIHG